MALFPLPVALPVGTGLAFARGCASRGRIKGDGLSGHVDSAVGIELSPFYAACTILRMFGCGETREEVEASTSATSRKGSSFAVEFAGLAGRVALVPLLPTALLCDLTAAAASLLRELAGVPS